MAQRKPTAQLSGDSVKVLGLCPVCETRYNPMEAKVLASRGEIHLLHVQCRKCLSSIAVLVSGSPSGMTSVGMLTDLTVDDLARLRGDERVTCDDVLDFHQMMQNPQQLF